MPVGFGYLACSVEFNNHSCYFKEFKMSKDLMKVAKENFNHFQVINTRVGLRFRDIFGTIGEIVAKFEVVVDEIETFAPTYDFDEKSPGNGYRAFVYVYNAAVKKALKLSKDVQDKRESFWFESRFYQKELQAFADVIKNLSVIATSLLENHKKAKDKCLLTEEGNHNNAITKAIKVMNMEAFYGPAALFHFPESIRGASFGIATLTTAYSEAYFSKENNIMKWLRFPFHYLKYYFCDETFTKRLAEINEHTQIDFAQSNIKLYESKIFIMLQLMAGTWQLSVNKTFKIPADPVIVFSETQKKNVEIPVPSTFIGPRPVSCRLLSASVRKGMSTQTSAAELSNFLVVHVHGGGWSTQSSKLHGAYLREWAMQLDVPIFSIDYRLAPRTPFPRPLDEVFFAYCWALNNMKSLGSTGENVVFVADSAGANIISGCLIKCIELGVKLPKGFLSIYGAFALNYFMAPARFMPTIETVLPYQLLMNMMKSYAGTYKPDEDTNTPNRQIPKNGQNRTVPVIPRNYLMSPYLAPVEILRKFPRTHVFTTNIDCCLDDGVEFAKKLRDADVDVRFEAYEGLNHGFLNFSLVSNDCYKGLMRCVELIADLLEIDKLTNMNNNNNNNNNNNKSNFIDDFLMPKKS